MDQTSHNLPFNRNVDIMALFGYVGCLFAVFVPASQDLSSEQYQNLCTYSCIRSFC